MRHDGRPDDEQRVIVTGESKPRIPPMPILTIDRIWKVERNGVEWAVVKGPTRKRRKGNVSLPWHFGGALFHLH